MNFLLFNTIFYPAMSASISSVRSVAKMRLASILIMLGIVILCLESRAGDHARIISENAILYIHAPSVPELRKAWQGTDLYKLSQLTEVKQISRALSDQMRFSNLPSEVEWETLLQDARYSASFGLFRRQEGPPAYAWIFDGRDSIAKFNGVFVAAERALLTHGWKRNAAASGGSQVKISALTSPQKSNKSTELVLVRWRDTYCLTDDSSLAREFAARALDAEAVGALSRKPGFLNALEQCKLPHADVLQFYCDPIEFAQAYQADPNDGVDPREVAREHGFSAIQGITGRISLPAEKYEMQFKAAIYAPTPYRLSMQLLDFKNSADLKVPDWVPDYLHTCTRVQMDLTDFLEHIAGPLNDVVGEGTLEDIVRDMKSQDGPGVDLQTDLFDHFTSNVLSLSESNIPINSTSERSLQCIELSDSAKVAACIRALLVNDPNAQSQRLPGQPYELWKYGFTDSAGPNLSSAGVMVANGHLLLASNTEAIRKLILTANGQYPRLNAAQDVDRSLSELNAFAGERCFLRQITRIDRDVMSAYELLRMGKLEGSESVYARFLDRLVTEASNQGKSLPDFAKLPEFNRIERYLGIGCGQAEVVPEGWMISGMVLRK